MTQAEFMTAFEAARGLLGHVARRLARGPVFSPDDLMQAALLALWQTRERVPASVRPVAWMVRNGRWAMSKHVQNHFRRSRRHAFTDLDTLGELELPAAAPDPPPDESAALLGLLPPAAVELVRRKVVDGVPARTLAAELGVTPWCVRHRVGVSLAAIRAALGG